MPILSYKSIYLTKQHVLDPIKKSPWGWRFTLENASLVTFLCNSARQVNSQRFLCETIAREKMCCDKVSSFEKATNFLFFHHYSNGVYPIVPGTLCF